MKRQIQVASAVIIGIAGTIIASRLLWKRATARMVARLFVGVSRSAAGSFSVKELHDLPVPVARYFEFALTPDVPRYYVPRYSRLRITQEGEMCVGGIGSPWKPFTAVQYFAANPPGFVWDAILCLVPLLTVQVRDSYVGGTGAGQVKIASLFALAGPSGRPELDAGALHRYLAEAVWCPAALLPSSGVVWEPIDDCTARATLRDGQTAVSLEFSFGKQGEIVRAYTPERFREVNGEFVPTPWTCGYSDYALQNGIRIPLQGTVEWALPEGRLLCFRVHLITAELLAD